MEHPEIVEAWHEDSNCLVLLSVLDELSLLTWRDVAHANGLATALMVEPDIGDECTALAVAPSHLTLFSALPLTGKEVANA